jgi:hypothetical protein
MESPNLNRREFLKGAAASGVISSLPEFLSAEEQESTDFIEHNIEDLRDKVSWVFLDQVDKVFSVPDNPWTDNWGQMFTMFKEFESQGSVFGFFDEENRGVIVREAKWNSECIEEFNFDRSESDRIVIVITDKNGSDCKVVAEYYPELVVG